MKIENEKRMRFSMKGKCRLNARARQAGLTLVELMISIVLGLLIVMAATALLVSSKVSYVSQDDISRLQDTARFALDAISRAARQGGYENWESADGAAPITTLPEMTANLAGLDANSVSATSAGISTPLGTSSAINGSDVLAIRFYGAGAAGNPDGTMINCAGLAQSPPVNQNDAEAGRAWSIFYVSNETDGEPTLRCKYYPDAGGAWKSESIARGVESFQVLYGLDTDSQYLPTPANPAKTSNPEYRIPNKFVTATAIKTLDDAIYATLSGTTAQKDALMNAQTNWKKVMSIKVALLIRGTENNTTSTATAEYYLFGKDYSDANPAVTTDLGSYIKVSGLPVATRYKARKAYLSTIQYRNQVEGSGIP